jgi:hypothetical protein
MIAKIHKGHDIFQMIFLSFQNLVIAPRAFHTPANLAVAIAACGESHKSMRAGATISPAHQEIAEIIQAASPKINTKKIIKKYRNKALSFKLFLYYFYLIPS